MDELMGKLAEQAYDSPRMVRMATMRERIDMAVSAAEKKLEDAKRAKEIFDKNPELEELINIMQRGGF